MMGLIIIMLAGLIFTATTNETRSTGLIGNGVIGVWRGISSRRLNQRIRVRGSIIMRLCDGRSSVRRSVIVEIRAEERTVRNPTGGLARVWRIISNSIGSKRAVAHRIRSYTDTGIGCNISSAGSTLLDLE